MTDTADPTNSRDRSRSLPVARSSEELALLGVFSKIGSFFKWLAKLFLEAAEWVQETFADPEMSRQIRADLGLDEDGEPLADLPPAQMAGIRAYLENNDPDKLAFAQLVEDISIVVDSIMDLMAVINTNPSQGRSNEEIFYQFMKIWATQHVRTRVHLVYALAKLIGAFQDQFGHVEDLDVDKVVGLFADQTPDPEDSNGFDEDDAQRLSHLVAFVSGVVHLLLQDVAKVSPDWFQSYYGWDPDPSVTPPRRDDEILQRAWTFIIGDPDDAISPKLLVTMLLVPTEDGGPGILFSLGGQLTFTGEREIEVRNEIDEVVDRRTRVYSAETTGAGALGIFFPFRFEAPTPSLGSDMAFAFSFESHRKPQPTDQVEPEPPAFRIGHRDSTRLDVGSLDYGFDIGAERGSVFARAKDVQLIVTLGEGDGFLASLPGDDITLELDIGVTADTQNGVTFDGGAGFKTTVPISKSLWDTVTVHYVAVEIAAAPDRAKTVRLEATTALSLTIGPVAATVEKFGFVLDTTFEPGNVGFADITSDFRPPKGIGLLVNAVVVKGGGYLYFDYDKSEYSGVLELKIGPVSIKAIGILTTEMPGGEEGWALLLGLYGEFHLQVFAGFTLLGIGGVLGVQHGLDIDALQSGVRTGILDNILFPESPTANAPRIINQLKAIFPITPRALVLAPMIRLGYGTPTIAELTVGVVLQYDNVFHADDMEAELTRFALVGRLLVEIPPKKDRPAGTPIILRLQVDISGSHDYPLDYTAVDARLRDSQVAGYTLTGSFILRSKGGEDPSFIAAIGGFNPRFKDLPANLPKQDRLGIKIKKGIAEIRVELYLAKTSNTWQVGLGLYVKAKKWGLTINAWLSFDGLFLREPVFHFFLDFKLGFTIKKGSSTLMEADGALSLRGPGYWTATAKVKIKFFFFSKTFDWHDEWGDLTSPVGQQFAVGQALQAALAEPDNWVAQLPAGGQQLVTFRSVDAEGAVLAHPMGRIEVTQDVVPLKLRIDKIDALRPSDGDRFDITEVTVGGQQQTPAYVRSHFARAQFLDLSNEERLEAESFEKFPSGVRFGSDDFAVPSNRQSAFPEYEIKYRGRPTRPDVTELEFDLLTTYADWGAAGQAGFSVGPFAGGVVAPVTLVDPPVAIATTDALEVVEQAIDETDTYSLMRQRLGDAAGHQMVEAHELEAQ